MVFRNIKNYLKKFIRFYLRKDKQCTVIGKTGGKNFKGVIRLYGNSLLKIGKNVRFNGSMTIWDSSEVIIEDGCNLEFFEITVQNGSKLFIGKETVVVGSRYNPVLFILDSGEIFLKGFNNIRSNIAVSFNGVVKMGEYTGIGTGSDIVCNESIRWSVR